MKPPEQRALASILTGTARLFTGLISLIALLSACSPPITPGAFVLTQSPVPSVSQPEDALDAKYPAGTRVVMVDQKFQHFTTLSKGLTAAGDPQVSYDGSSVFFCGKFRPGMAWQIYHVKLPDGAPRALTSVPGGAMNPLLLPDGEVAFVSPVPKPGVSNPPAALYVSSPGTPPRRLTFSPADLSDPTLLADGRILFVSHRRCDPADGPGGYSLSTINNDGTEISEFTSLADPLRPLERPRQLPDGRIVFLAADTNPNADRHVQFVRSSRPFFGSEPLLSQAPDKVFSVQPGNGDTLLFCATPALNHKPASPITLALYRVPARASQLDTPLFTDPSWNCLEAVDLAPHKAPMGRLSNVDPAEKTGQILCLNANFTQAQSGTSSPATRVRVLAQLPGDNVRPLGEVPLQSDGSFMAEVPADVALGFETIDTNGRILSRLEPSIWVRPGENRACIGCHEPHNQSPRNSRPLAVRVPVPHLKLESLNVAQRKP